MRRLACSAHLLGRLDLRLRLGKCEIIQKCLQTSNRWPQKVVVSLRFPVSPDSPPHRPGVRRRKILVGRWAGAIGRGRVDRAPPWARWTCDRLRSRCAPAWRLRLSGWSTRAPRRWSKTSRPPSACSVGRVGFALFEMRQLQLPERLNRAQRRGSDRPMTWAIPRRVVCRVCRCRIMCVCSL